MNAHPSSLSDRELLELAARAAGLQIDDDIHGVVRWMAAPQGAGSEGWWVRWNPLVDNGDALALAVTLGLDVCQDQDSKCVDVAMPDTDWLSQPYGDDPFAATRRAIVRAASSIIPRAK